MGWKTNKRTGGKFRVGSRRNSMQRSANSTNYTQTRNAVSGSRSLRGKVWIDGEPYTRRQVWRMRRRR